MNEDEDAYSFVDAEWEAIAQVKTVEPKDEYQAGWRHATLYQYRSDNSKVCLFFGDLDYEGLDPSYSFVDGIVRDGDGDEVSFVDPIVIKENTIIELDYLDDPELDELENDGGGYLSSDDGDVDFILGGEGDKNIIKM